MDCGPTCLRMISSFYGRNLSIQKLRDLCFVNRSGVSLLAISDAAEKIGLRSAGIKLSVSQLAHVELPCILHWRQDHFVVLYQKKKDFYYLADPAKGLLKLDKKTFTNSWFSHKETSEGISLLINASPAFYQQENDHQDNLQAAVATFIIVMISRWR